MPTASINVDEFLSRLNSRSFRSVRCEFFLSCDASFSGSPTTEEFIFHAAKLCGKMKSRLFPQVRRRRCA